MSFTAEVKDELSRIEGSRANEVAELAAIVRTCGTLSFSSHPRFSLSLSTETGSVARLVIKLFRGVYDLPCELTVRRSVLHKTRNYLLRVTSGEDSFVNALVEMGVLSKDRGLAREIPPELVSTDAQAAAYLRGAFMAGGFISEPHADAHFELVAQTVPFAEGLSGLLRRFDLPGRVCRRRGSFIIYAKNGEDIERFLATVGAPRSVLKMEEARLYKSVRNETNRRVNAEFANQRKASQAASNQSELIDAIDREIGFDRLPPALRDFCELRRANPDLSLRELGEAAQPPLSKSAVAHRVRRLEGLLAETRGHTAGGGVKSL